MIDIGHEALIRSWRRLSGQEHDFKSGWVLEEARDGLSYRWLSQHTATADAEPLSGPLITSWARTLPDSKWTEHYGGDFDRVSAAVLAAAPGIAETTSQKAHDDLQPSESAPSLPAALVGLTGAEAGPMTYRWWRVGLERAAAVASIRQRRGDHRVATGFLVRAADLGLEPGGELLVMTVFYVVNEQGCARHESGTVNGLKPEDAEVVFEAVDPNRAYLVDRIVWSSPIERHDVSLLRLQTPVTGIEPLPFARSLPWLDPGAEGAPEPAATMADPSARFAPTKASPGGPVVVAPGATIRARAAFTDPPAKCHSLARVLSCWYTSKFLVYSMVRRHLSRTLRYGGKEERQMTEASRSSGPEESVFRLLVPPSETVSSESASIDVAGQRWQVVDHGAVPSPADAPEYTCVSYSWAGETKPNPFDPERPMSSRAVPVLETAIAALRPPAIWLDAACMPRQEPARSLCLRSMGAIYAAASGVLAVLLPSASTLLDKFRREEVVGSEELRRLEADDWVSRAWTYQEMVNSKIISFVAEGETGDPVSGYRLLNAVGDAIAQYRKAEQVDAYEFRKRRPRLDALETLIDDWLRADYAERSAYRIMSAMAGRTAVYPDDYFYAMVGAVTSAPPADPTDATLNPPEYFMRVCEQKGDFSFIYSSARRASGGANGWRPRPPRRRPLRPIVPWPSVGERQTGELQPASLRLHNMASVALGQLDGAARTFVHDWLKTVRSPLPPGIGDAVRKTLRRAGFTGRGKCLETKCGLFFPLHPLPDAGTCVVFVATDIFFNFGAPGLLVDPAEAGTARLRDVGVFVGPVPKTRETVIIG